MNIAITGATGFIGKYLVQEFSNHNILVISPRKESPFSNNIAYLSSDNQLLLNRKREILDFNPDVFFFCGWWGGQSFNSTQSICQLEKNTYPLISFIEDIKNDLKKTTYVGIGSAAEYGHMNHPITEEEKETPISLYGLSKFFLKEYLRTSNLRWIWVRPCTLYGYGDIQTRLIPKTILGCLRGEEIRINNCLTIMDYLYIKDFATAIRKLVELDCGGVYNIGSGTQKKIKDVILLIQKMIGDGYIVFDESLNRQNFPEYVCVNINKIISKIGTFQQYDLERGLEETIRQYVKI